MVWRLPVEEPLNPKQVVGLFSKLIPFRVALTPTMTLDEALRSIKITLAEDLMHQRFPVSRLNREPRAPRLGAYDVAINYVQNDFDFNIGGKRVICDNLSSGFVEPLRIMALDFSAEDPLRIVVDYDQGRVMERELERFLACYQALLSIDPGDRHSPRRLADTGYCTSLTAGGARVTAFAGFVKRYEVIGAVALTLMVQTSISLLSASVPVLAPAIAVDRGWGVDVITFYTPIVYLVAFAANFLVPQLLARFGGMGLSLISVAVSAVGLLCLLPASVASAFFVPIAIGFATAAMNPASFQVLGPRTSASNAGLIMSFKQTGVPLGAMLAGILAPVLVIQFGWRQTILEVAFASAVIAIALLPTLRWLDSSKGATPNKSYRPFGPAKSLLALPGMQRFMIAGMSCAAMLLCLRTFFIVYLVSHVGFDLVTAGIAFGASQAAGIVGQVGWAALSDRKLGAHPVLGLLCFLMAIAAALTALVTINWPTAAVIGLAVLFGISAAGHLPVVLGEVVRRSPPGQAGVLTSGANVFLIGGIIIGPLLFGVVAWAFGYAIAFLVLAFCSFGGALTVVLPLFSVAPTSFDGHDESSRGKAMFDSVCTALLRR